MSDPIQEKANELGRLVGQTPEYQAMRRARDRVGDDRELVRRLNRLAELEADVTRSVQRGQAPSQAVQDEYETLASQVQSSATYQELVAGQANLERVLHRVNEEMARGMESGSQSRIILPT